jgi:hypothetical protein
LDSKKGCTGVDASLLLRFQQAEHAPIAIGGLCKSDQFRTKPPLDFKIGP